MEHEELELLDREQRIFACFQAAIGLMQQAKEPDQEKAKDLLDFLADEYNKARQALMDRVRQKAACAPIGR